MHQKQKENLRKFYKNKKFKPLDLRAKKTRALRRQLSKSDLNRKTKKTLRKLQAYPARMYAVKA